ncbi:hypothetical protein F3J23_05165 [Chryseobacterium sp. Tr-659]|uniref:hypothetical protein n=1 Tax=Chryseobacterium sp. Tr-659 TaxID=2608340 RepID=UPI0014248253|nr:hypothetical protein [Chryseobacterium sp. Tr-659]NIF04826.1 hypothetical protein [Chryseobacterium sp. Tr-659]
MKTRPPLSNFEIILTETPLTAAGEIFKNIEIIRCSKTNNIIEIILEYNEKHYVIENNRYLFIYTDKCITSNGYENTAYELYDIIKKLTGKIILTDKWKLISLDDIDLI